MGQDFDAPDSLVALTVSIYLASVGIGQLIWGPFSDRFGRLPILYGSLLVYLAFTIACIFASTIIELLILRTIQGLIVGASIIVAQAAVADVFPSKERGAAMEALLGPMLVGPVIAPILMGVLSQAFSWRATFVLLAALVPPAAILTFVAIPGTD